MSSPKPSGIKRTSTPTTPIAAKTISRPVARVWQTKQQVVYSLLRERIMTNQIAPGQRVVIDDIARQEGVSAIPVREAIQMLSAEGLVENRPHAGAIVAPITDDSVTEVFRLMEALSVVAARSACERLTPDDLAHMDRLILQMDEAAEKHDGLAWARLNADFHKAAALFGLLPKTRPLMDRIFDEWTRIRWFFWGTDLVRDPVQAQVQHRAILKAIRSQDADNAQHLTETHHRTALKHYQRLLKESQNPTTA